MQYLVILECTGLGIFICHVTHIILLLYELLNTKQNKKQTNKQTKNKSTPIPSDPTTFQVELCDLEKQDTE